MRSAYMLLPLWVCTRSSAQDNEPEVMPSPAAFLVYGTRVLAEIFHGGHARKKGFVGSGAAMPKYLNRSSDQFDRAVNCFEKCPVLIALHSGSRRRKGEDD